MKHVFLIVSCITMVSCSTVGFKDLFTDYASQLMPVRQAIKQNNISQATQALAENSAGHSNFLLNQLEHGRIDYLANNKPASQQQFEAVYQQMQAHRQAATLQVSSGLEQTNALLSNDSVIRYIPPAYEMSMLHSYKALNYTYDNELEAALVEVRRANKVQADELNAKQDEISEQAKNASANYPSMDALIGDVKNGFQNAFTFYLSGLLYEASKQFDDAYIDYKKALEITPNNQYLQQSVLRLAKQQGFTDDLARFEKTYTKTPPAPENSGKVIVLVEQGLIPEKSEFDLRLPIFTSRGDARFYSIAIPVYRTTPYNSVQTLHINQQTKTMANLVNLEALAAKTLSDQAAGRISRQILRLVAKEKMRAELARSGGDVGNILANIYNLASEQADTRSWLTLPNQIHLVTDDLAAGEHQLSFGQQQINFTVSKRGLTLVYLTSINNYFNSHVVQL